MGNKRQAAPAIQAAETTIAVTVYDRRDYVREAIRSALALGNKGDGPQVLVVEDCGPDAELREWIRSGFGDQIRYHRNPSRRGLFDNWNSCIEHCATRWLCILHDDDTLEPNFIKAMQELSSAAPNRALYYGLCRTIDRQGRCTIDVPQPGRFEWHELDLEACTRHDPVCFPGQLFDVAAARALGGFRLGSHYCADWEMWFRLALHGGAAGTNRVIANYREHHAAGRGTTKVNVSGRKFAYINMQRKRHVAWLRPQRPEVVFNREKIQCDSPLPTRFLLQHARTFSPLMLKYNAALLRLSAAPHVGYRIIQLLTSLFTWRSLRLASRIFGRLAH
ncbi:MAG TPA: glycosyltransferase [Chthoniobacterales bacterium]|jgi:glycosyltransferase involved in cell wall biosynthesis